MKTLKTIIILSTLFISTMSIASKEKKGNELVGSGKCIPEITAEPKFGKITFKAGKLIEVAVLTITDGKENQFFGEYFSQAIKLAPKYEARPIVSFAIEKTEAGNSPAKMIVFFEWGSLEMKRAFERDFDFLRIKHLRSGALSYLSTGYFSVSEDVTYTVTEGKTYEFAALWLDPANAPKLEKYFNAVLPLAVDPKIQFELITQLQKSQDNDGDFHPNLIFLSEWKIGLKGKQELISRKTFKENFHLRQEASPYNEIYKVIPLL